MAKPFETKRVVPSTPAPAAPVEAKVAPPAPAQPMPVYQRKAEVVHTPTTEHKYIPDPRSGLGGLLDRLDHWLADLGAGARRTPGQFDARDAADLRRAAESGDSSTLYRLRDKLLRDDEMDEGNRDRTVEYIDEVLAELAAD
jgi:hypothetical protein